MIYKSKFFLGDNGTMFLATFIGLIIIFAHNVSINSNPIPADLIFIILMFPGFDMLRLFITRILNKKNPFKGDLNHLHHHLMRKFNLNYSLFIYLSFSLTPIIISKKNSKFPIHDDTPNKLLSGVIYLAPENNSGTFFYSDKKGSDKTNVEWKSNRAVFFSRKERETWHSYQGDGLNDRVVLVYNLMTNRIKEVYKIEKKNYFFGNLRFKLNPYIFRYFKNTI